jgi:arsenate reductase
MKIFHNPRCSKSRETLQIIQDNNLEVEIIEYLKEVPTKKELKELIGLLNIDPIELIRKGEKDFKENFKGKNLTDDQWLEAMVKYPKLIERPIVVKGNRAIIGRPPENVKSLF